MAHFFESGLMVGKSAWHGMGKTLDLPVSPCDAYVESGLNWKVEKKELYYKKGKTYTSLNDLYALVRDRDGKALGTCTDTYRIFQNSEAFDLIATLVHSGKWTVNTCGSLKEGRICWVLLLQNTVDFQANDQHKQYLLMTWGHDGQTGVTFMPTTIRVVCWNTLSAALMDVNKVTFKHTEGVVNRLGGVIDLFNDAAMTFDEQQAIFREMLNVGISKEKIGDILHEIYAPQTKEGEKPDEKEVKEAEDTVANYKRFAIEAPTWQMDNAPKYNRYCMETVYGLFNAITECNEYYRYGQRSKDIGYSVLYGTCMENNRHAYRWLINNFLPHRASTLQA